MAAVLAGTLQEPQIERREHQDNSDVNYQPLPQLVPEEQDVHADHDGYQGEHVKHDGCLSSHSFVLLCATEWSKNGGDFSESLPDPIEGHWTRPSVVQAGHIPSWHGSCERYALPSIAGDGRWLLLLLSPLLSAAAGLNGADERGANPRHPARSWSCRRRASPIQLAGAKLREPQRGVKPGFV